MNLKFKSLLAFGLLYSAAVLAGLNQVPGPVYGNQAGTAAAAGFLGQTITPSNLTGVSLTSGNVFNISSASLPPGDYEVSCDAIYVIAGTTTATSFGVGISTTSATFGSSGTYTSIVGSLAAGSGNPSIVTPQVQQLITTTTTVYCVANANFAISTVTVSGYLHVRRVQ